MALTITTTSGSASFDSPVTEFSKTAGQYYLKYPKDEEKYALELHKSGAVAGFLEKRHNFDSRMIGPIEVAYVGTTRAACNAAYNTDHNAIRNAKATVVLPNDGSYENCDVIQFPSGSPKDTGHGTFMMRTFLRLRQERPNG